MVETGLQQELMGGDAGNLTKHFVEAAYAKTRMPGHVRNRDLLLEIV